MAKILYAVEYNLLLAEFDKLSYLYVGSYCTVEIYSYFERIVEYVEYVQ